MHLSTQQTQQLALIISSAFDELRNRSHDPSAVASLAYASHNLSFLGINDHHSVSYIRSQFEDFHQKHGYFMFDFVTMMTTLEQDAPPCASFPK